MYIPPPSHPLLTLNLGRRLGAVQFKPPLPLRLYRLCGTLLLRRLQTEDADGRPSQAHQVERSRASEKTRADAYLAYQARWMGKDFFSGLTRGGGYTWTAPTGVTPDGDYFDHEHFTGKYTSTAQPIFKREMSLDDGAHCVWRLDALPANFPRLRWRGVMAPGNIRAIMEALGQQKIDRPRPDSEVDSFQEARMLFKPVGKSGVGLKFKDYLTDEQIDAIPLVFDPVKNHWAFPEREIYLVEWDRLSTQPVAMDVFGTSLVSRRKQVWVPVPKVVEPESEPAPESDDAWRTPQYDAESWEQAKMDMSNVARKDLW